MSEISATGSAASWPDGRESAARPAVPAASAVPAVPAVPAGRPARAAFEAPAGRATPAAPGRRAARGASWDPPDARRRLQLVLAAVWLLDAVLQYQPFMFTKAFGQTLAAAAEGNPALVAVPITWTAHIVEGHPTLANAAFATVQLLLALGIAWRPTVTVALAASIVWSLAVWWLGEGLGGVLAGTANTVDGAPGAVIIYALLAVLLWPVDRSDSPSFVAERPVGALPARLLWLVLWDSLAYFAVPSAGPTAQGLHDMISGMAGGQPGWIASIDRGAADLLAHRGVEASIIFAIVLAVVAAGIFLPVPGARAAVLLGAAAGAAIWVVGQNFGAIFTGSATDPNSGLLLILLAAAYWPTRPTAPAALAPRKG